MKALFLLANTSVKEKMSDTYLPHKLHLESLVSFSFAALSVVRSTWSLSTGLKGYLPLSCYLL